MPKILKHYLKLLKENSFIPQEETNYDISEYNIISERYILLLQIIGLLMEGIYIYIFCSF